MRFVALAADYDGTLAHHGRVAPSTPAALERLKATGRRLIMVTGRELPDLESVFPHKALFDLVVAENGALLHTPATGETRVLAAPPPAAFVEELRRRKVQPLSVGATIVATWTPHENTVLEVIREIGLELQVIFNKGAVMVLPAGTNKATGLACALEQLGLSAHNVVAIGDAENDHALLAMAECAAAVSNAVPMLREAADLRTRGDHGTGVEELIDAMIGNDLADIPLRKPERHLTIGTRDDGEGVHLPIAGPSFLVTGTSGSGKSTLVTGMVEQLLARRYQCCIIDPEGDYEELADTIMFGTPERAPSVTEILTALEKPDASVVVNLLGVKLPDRPAFFARLLSRLQAGRTLAGRPHWIVVDEAHHLLPADWQPAPEILSEVLSSMIYVTVHPETLSPTILKRIDAMAAIGDDPQQKEWRSWCRAEPRSHTVPAFQRSCIRAGRARQPDAIDCCHRSQGAALRPIGRFALHARGVRRLKCCATSGPSLHPTPSRRESTNNVSFVASRYGPCCRGNRDRRLWKGSAAGRRASPSGSRGDARAGSADSAVA